MSNPFLASFHRELSNLRNSSDGVYIPHLSMGNGKLKSEKITSFGLVAGVTCPGAAQCNDKRFCYAQNGRYIMSDAMRVRTENFLSSKQKHFVSSMVTLLRTLPKGWDTVRLHDSGDFYSQDYVEKWEEIIFLNKNKFFYTYTKSLNLNFKKLTEKSNVLLIQSEGSKFDNLIDYSKPHAKVFSSENDLESAGYVNATNSDLRAIKSIKIGLVIHGTGKNRF
jgi:hypothetical protein